MTSNIRNFIFAFVFVLGIAGQASAYHYRPPFFHHGHYAGVPYGYGYWHFPGWPGGITIDPIASGFSFYPYYHYQPYYATFAAISYSVTDDKGGYAWGQSSLRSAIHASRNLCGGVDCQPVVWVQGGCASLAVSRTEGRLGWAYANSKYEAIRNAMRACRAGVNSPKDCEARAWVCTQ